MFLTTVEATNVKFIPRVLGQQELPVENVVLQQVGTTTVQGESHIHKNLTNFSSRK